MAKDKGSGKKRGGEASEAATAAMAANEPRLRRHYDERVRATIAEKFGITNRNAQPKLDKIVINVNMGRHLEGTKIPVNVKTSVLDTLAKVSGQKPVVIAAKKSVSNFKVREGYETSAKVTMRRDRMWHFLDRFINLAAPRIKDFRGLPDKAFDRQGSYAFGLNEQGVFPEIDMSQGPFTHGMNINICFRNSTPELSRHVLSELGFPFVKPQQKIKRG